MHPRAQAAAGTLQVGDVLLSVDGRAVKDDGAPLTIPPANRHAFVLRRTSKRSRTPTNGRTSDYADSPGGRGFIREPTRGWPYG